MLVERRKHVCFLLYNLDPGGLETHLLRFIRYAGGEFDSSLIVKKGISGPLYFDLEKEDVTIHLIKTGYFNIVGWFKIFSLFRKKRFDAVCDFTSNFSGIYLLLAFLAGIKIRIGYYGQSVHHFNKNFLKNSYDQFVNFLVRKFSTTAIFNSVAALNFFFPGQKEDKKKYRIIFNGIDTKEFCESAMERKLFRQSMSIPEDAFVIVHTGRYDEKKNHKAVLKLAEKLIERYDFVYVVLCGKDTEKIGVIIPPDCSNRIITLGFRKDVSSILASADAFYFPSFTESQPNSLIEAMIMGLPFVASDIQPIKEAIPPDYYGQLVAPDNIEGAYKLFQEIIEDRMELDFKVLSQWASDKYNADKRFVELRDALLGSFSEK